MSRYTTLAGTGQGTYKEKGSRFTGIAVPVADEAQVKAELELIRTRHAQATHHCYAFRLGAGGEVYRNNDDGEPGGSAGKPILNQILSKGVTNCLVVVVRYYGGTKLGVGGLMNAYKEAASLALDEAGTIGKEVLMWYDLDFGYENIAAVNRLLREAGASIASKNFDVRCKMRVGISQDFHENFAEKCAGPLHIGCEFRFRM